MLLSIGLVNFFVVQAFNKLQRPGQKAVRNLKLEITFKFAVSIFFCVCFNQLYFAFFAKLWSLILIEGVHGV